jgi:hypothetical protein
MNQGKTTESAQNAEKFVKAEKQRLTQPLDYELLEFTVNRNPHIPVITAAHHVAGLARDHKGSVTYFQYDGDGKTDAQKVGTVIDSDLLRARQFECSITYNPNDTAGLNSAKALEHKIKIAFQGNPNIPYSLRHKK